MGEWVGGREGGWVAGWLAGWVGVCACDCFGRLFATLFVSALLSLFRSFVRLLGGPGKRAGDDSKCSRLLLVTLGILPFLLFRLVVWFTALAAFAACHVFAAPLIGLAVCGTGTCRIHGSHQTWTT